MREEEGFFSLVLSRKINCIESVSEEDHALKSDNNCPKMN